MSFRHSLLIALGVVGAVMAQAERVEVRGPRPITYELEAARPETPRWLRGWRLGYPRPVEFGRRVVVQTVSTNAPAFRQLVPRLRVQRQVNERTWLLEAATAWDAVRAAALLAGTPDIEVAVPTSRRRVRPHYPLAPEPNDPYFVRQSALETRDLASPFLPVASDLNAREAWFYTKGENIIVGVGDDGIESTHRDLAANYAGPNYNFLTDTPGGAPMTNSLFHGTAVAGIIAAVGDNRTGLTGVAPRARLASWVIFDDTATGQPDEAGFAALFGQANQEVAVQNHSWGNDDNSFVEVSLLENLAIEKAVTQGRGGRGVVMVRSAGNRREMPGDANLDGYANDLRQIAVAAVRPDGQVASYSTPGACVLVAALGGDYRGGYSGLVTTDRTGVAGFNAYIEPGDPTSNDYLVGSRLFVGTSASAPLVSGVAALVLSARPALRWFEVQQVLALSARHYYFGDADFQTNGAGFRVSPNTGFGVPDAGVAVRLAGSWRLQGKPNITRMTNAATRLIPDAPVGGTPSPLRYDLAVTNAMALQHVQVLVRWSHPRGRDLRVTLTSPKGTRSLLLRSGTAAEPVPDEWTFSSVACLGEAARGTWVLEFLDTAAGESGEVEEIGLVLRGRAITDSDNDGLEDAAELAAFANLDRGPSEDPDGDGWNNAAEQMAGRNWALAEEPFVASISRANAARLRLSWPAGSRNYEVWGAPDAGQPLTLITNVPAQFPEAGWFFDGALGNQLFEVRTTTESR